MAEKPQSDPMLKVVEDVAYIRGRVDRMAENMDDHKDVHAELNTRLNKHSDAIRSLQETRAQGKGMVILSRVIGTAIGALAGAAAAAATIASMMVHK